VKLPAHRAGLPGNEISFFIVPLDPAYKAGLAGHLPAINKTAKEKSPDATPPFGFAQGRESFDLAQDRELVERQMDF
jgi:hypothetical protein